MKFVQIFFLVGLIFSCNTPPTNKSTEVVNNVFAPEEKDRLDAFKSIVNPTELIGGILVYDLENDHYFSNDFDWAEKAHLPASTFKIPNSIIALEMGVAKNDSTLLKWNGESRTIKSWEQDLTLKEAFHLSCVPCYQEIAKEIGVKKMNSYLEQFNYGKITVDSSNLSDFWLVGEAKISQFQQIDFLKRFYLNELPVSDNTAHSMKKLMVINQTEDHILRGKTGWSIKNEVDNGWFVGYIETNSNVYFFATNLEPTPKFDINLFGDTRKNITYEALQELGILQ